MKNMIGLKFLVVGLVGGIVAVLHAMGHDSLANSIAMLGASLVAALGLNSIGAGLASGKGDK